MDGKYLVRLVGAVVAYVLVLGVSLWLVEASFGAWWKFLVAPLPMIPAVFIVVVFLGALGRMDELQRRIQLEALAFAFGGTALLTFGYGFMETVGLPRLSWFFVWGVMAALWGLGVVVARWRFR